MAAKVLGNSGVLYTDRRDFYISPQVVKELWTDVAPFTTAISNRETRSGLADPQFKMFEHRNPWQKQQFASASGDGFGTVNVGDAESAALDIDGIVGLAAAADSSYLGLECEVWDAALAVKRGVALITSVVDADTVKFKNMGDADLEVDEDDVFIVIGNAHGEGTSSPEAWSDELQVVYNQAQIFKTPVEVTGTLYEAALRGERDELARLRLQKSQEHKIQKERAFLFGRSPINISGGFVDASISDADGKTVRSTMGIIPAIEKHGDTSGDDQSRFTITKASYTYSNFVDHMEKVFQYVPEAGSKRAFCGGGALSYWSKLGGDGTFSGSSGWTINLGDMKRDSLGFNYRNLETPHGMLQLIPTPVLRGPYNEYMLVVSDENLFMAQYRAPKYQANIKTDNAYDGVKDQYMSDEGIGVTLVESHKLFKMV